MAPRTGNRGDSKEIYPLQCKTELRKNSFVIRATKQWNNLPDDIVLAPSVNSFKGRLDKYFAGSPIMYEDYKFNV